MLKNILRCSPQWVTALAVLESGFGEIVCEEEQTGCVRVGPFIMVEGLVSNTALAAVFTSLADGDIVTSSSAHWYAALLENVTVHGTLTPLVRQAFHWGGNAQSLVPWLEHPLPDGVHIRRINQEDARLLDAQSWSEGIFASYGSQKAFLARGLGYCLLHENQHVAVCLSFADSSAGVEIEVDTCPGFEGRGYATLVCARFVGACLDRHWIPLWDATNPASAAIARKLGFVEGEQYTVLEFAAER